MISRRRAICSRRRTPSSCRRAARSPASFNRATGEYLVKPEPGWRGDAGGQIGGTQALLADDQIYAVGEHHILALDQQKREDRLRLVRRHADDACGRHGLHGQRQGDHGRRSRARTRKARANGTRLETAATKLSADLKKHAGPGRGEERAGRRNRSARSAKALKALEAVRTTRRSCKRRRLQVEEKRSRSPRWRKRYEPQARRLPGEEGAAGKGEGGNQPVPGQRRRSGSARRRMSRR